MLSQVRIVVAAAAAVTAMVAPALAQPTVVRTRTVFAFTHDGAHTDHYDVCVDGARPPCIMVKAAREQGDDWRFTLPWTVPRGSHKVTVWAVGATGKTAGGNLVAVRVVKIPAAPGKLIRK